MQRTVQPNIDFSDVLRTLLSAGAELLVVGARALRVHDRARATKDLDVWICPTGDDARRVRNALGSFATLLDRLTIDDLVDEDTVFQIGVPPVRTELLTSISGVTFGEAWPARVEVERDGLMNPFIGVDALLRNKDASGRDQDRVDAARVRRRLALGCA
jgi:hypothetical protein